MGCVWETLTKVHFGYEMLIFIRPSGDIEERVDMNLDLRK